MCGLVGILGNLETKDEAAFKMLLLLDTTRGLHSTGMAAVRDNKAKEIFVAKAVGNPFELFDTKPFEKAMNAFQSKVFIGHNRFATKGEHTRFNAHPFHYGDIVGAHNGTLQSQYDLEKALDEQFKVDSQALIAGIDKFGIKETLGMCRGAWALTFYDQANDTMHFIKNKERPLWWAWSEDKKKMYWASEWWMLQTLEHSNGVKFWHNKKGYAYFPFEDDTLYTLDMSTGHADALPLMKTKKVAGAAPLPIAPSTNYGNRAGAYSNPTGGGYWKNGTWIKLENGAEDKNKDPFLRGTIEQEKDAKKVVHLFPEDEGASDLKDPYLGNIEPDVFKSLTHHGCSFCGKEIVYGDQGIELFVEDDIALCSKHASGNGKVTRINKKDISLPPLSLGKDLIVAK